MKIVGVDCDGTLTRITFFNPSVKLPWWLFLFLIFLVFIPPKKEVVERLRKVEKDGGRIIIVSARPKQLTGLSRVCLRIYKVPYAKVFCVGFGKDTKNRKLDVIKKESINAFFDDDGKLVVFLTEQSVNASGPDKIMAI